MSAISKKSKETTSDLSGIHQEFTFRKAAEAAVPTSMGKLAEVEPLTALAEGFEAEPSWGRVAAATKAAAAVPTLAPTC